VFAARAASACHWSWSTVGDDQRPTEGDSRLRGTRELLQQATDVRAPRSCCTVCANSLMLAKLCAVGLFAQTILSHVAARRSSSSSSSVDHSDASSASMPASSDHSNDAAPFSVPPSSLSSSSSVWNACHINLTVTVLLLILLAVNAVSLLVWTQQLLSGYEPSLVCFQYRAKRLPSVL